MNQFIRCIDCGEGFMKTPFDQCPEYDHTHPSEPVQIIERDDFRDFLISHRRHQLEYLEIIEDSFVSEKLYSEPVKISYLRATNKKEKFVIKRFRENIGEPVKYQLIPGDCFLECLGVEIQSNEITKQLRAELKGHSFSQTQISAFLTLYRHIVQVIDIKNLERISEESSCPLEIFYKMGDISLFYLLRNCRNIFKGKGYPAIEEFIFRHKDGGVLLLKAKYRIHISEKPKRKKETASPDTGAEVKKVVEKY